MQELILHNLCTDQSYCSKVIPFIQPEFFKDLGDKLVFLLVKDFVSRYNKAPTFGAIQYDLEGAALQEGPHKAAVESLTRAESASDVVDRKWLYENTEIWAQDRKVYLAATEIVNTVEGKTRDRYGRMIELMREAVGFTFDSRVGHDFVADAGARWDYYHNPDTKVPLDLRVLNDVTDGGFSQGTLNLFLAGPHVGKSLTLCHLAGGCYMSGKKVLYLTLEMLEEMTTMRIDANLLNTPIKDIKAVPKEVFLNRIAAVNKMTKGQFIVREYPSRTAHVGHFRTLLSDLELKQNFVPDIIFIDYLNICQSQTLSAKDSGSYEYMGSIACELRALASDKRVPIVSATQVNRAGFKSSEFDMDNTADSFAVPMHADAIWGLAVTDELKEAGQIKVMQLKNRYTDMNLKPSFLLGVDRQKFRLFDVEEGQHIH